MSFSLAVEANHLSANIQIKNAPEFLGKMLLSDHVQRIKLVTASDPFPFIVTRTEKGLTDITVVNIAPRHLSILVNQINREMKNYHERDANRERAENRQPSPPRDDVVIEAAQRFPAIDRFQVRRPPHHY